MAERKAAPRGRTAAKRAGAKFEITLAEYFRKQVSEHVQRQDKNGANDLGDIAGVRLGGKPVIIECKNTSSVNLTAAMREARREAENFAKKYGTGLPFAVVAHKRHGVAAPERQWITMEVSELVSMIQWVQDRGLEGDL